MSRSTSSERALRAALRGNAVFSSLSGIVLLAAAIPLRDELGLGSGWEWLLRGLGLGLLGYAAWLLVVARASGRALREAGIAAAAGDVVWVAGSIVVLALVDMPSTGQALVGVTAGIVGLFAIWQAIGVARLSVPGDQPIFSSGA
jgi:hypothetical protein